MPKPRARLTFLLATGCMLAGGVLTGFWGCLFDTHYQAPRILFMGNSLTLSPKIPERNWTHVWGMAASALEKDYVHQTATILKGMGMDAEPIIANRPCPQCDGGIDEQIHNMDQVRKLRPRYVVVQLSEHSGEIEIRSGKMARQYHDLLAALADAGVPHVYCLGSWGEKSIDDLHNQGILYGMGGFANARFLDISSISADTASYADTTVSTDLAVRWHPGDQGMRRIAETVADAVWADR